MPADVIGFYDFVLPRARKTIAGAARPRTLLWYIPDFNKGSGGHLNIFRTIWHLERMGWESAIVLVQPRQHADAEAARRDIAEHFFALQAPVYLEHDELPACEFVVATGWQTAYPVRDLECTATKVYFLQDFEPYFYARGGEYLLAENTYRFGFFGIVVGDWLARKLRSEYGMRTHTVGFGVEPERYRRLPRYRPAVKRVFFYARPPTPRRAFEVGMLALNEVWRRRPETEFALAGWDLSDHQIGFPHRSYGTLDLDDLAELYSQCDVGLVLSMTNLSLLPLELMACGCVVVSNRGENVEWLLNDDIAVLADGTPEALAEAICGQLEDDAGRCARSERSEALARRQTWQAVADAFAEGLARAARP